MTDPIRAAGYIRVSTEEQRKHGWNLGADRERIVETVAERGWMLHDIYDDGGKQGDDPTRPGFTQMLAEAGEFDVLVMRDLDRFSRKLAIYAAAVDDLLEAGVALYEFEGDGTGLRPLNLDDEDDRALADVKAVFAQLEKAKTKRRVRQAVQARGRAGQHLGVAPYAYEFVDKLLVVVPEEAVIVTRIYGDYVRGMSQRATARALNADRVPAAGGGSGGRARSRGSSATPCTGGRSRIAARSSTAPMRRSSARSCGTARRRDAPRATAARAATARTGLSSSSAECSGAAGAARRSSAARPATAGGTATSAGAGSSTACRSAISRPSAASSSTSRSSLTC